MSISNYDDLEQVLADAGGVKSVSMAELRDAHGAGKLGSIVVENISSELAKRGIGHWPESLPTSQWQMARLYKRGTPIGDMLKALTTYDDSSDEKLMQFAQNNSGEVIRKIRELVC